MASVCMGAAQRAQRELTTHAQKQTGLGAPILDAYTRQPPNPRATTAAAPASSLSLHLSRATLTHHACKGRQGYDLAPLLLRGVDRAKQRGGDQGDDDGLRIFGQWQY